MTERACPCDSGETYGACCEPFIDRRAKPPTAEALMRSRYSAFARGEVDYLVATHDPAKRVASLREQVAKWAAGATFTGLEIHDTERGGPDDTTGIVEFTARFTEKGAERNLRERSRFRRIDGAWFYVDGKTPTTATVVRGAAKVGRNAPCPCGGGKKYKRCCGR